MIQTHTVLAYVVDQVEELPNAMLAAVAAALLIESVNARIRKAVRACGHFPTEQAALKCVYLAVMSLDPPRPSGNKQPTSYTTRWTHPLASPASAEMPVGAGRSAARGLYGLRLIQDLRSP